MKKYINLLIIPLLCLCLASCSTSRNMVFHGKPGTKVYTASGSTLLATIGSTGEAKIKLSDNVRSAFFYAQPAGSSLRIPFGLDYKKCGYGMNRFLEGLGMTTSVIGDVAMVAGAIAAGVDSESSAPVILVGGGAGVALLGASFGIPESHRLWQNQQENGMKYITDQMCRMIFSLRSRSIPASGASWWPTARAGSKAAAAQANFLPDKMLTTPPMAGALPELWCRCATMPRPWPAHTSAPAALCKPVN